MVGWRHPVRRRATHLLHHIGASGAWLTTNWRVAVLVAAWATEMSISAVTPASARLGCGWARLSASPHAVRSRYCWLGALCSSGSGSPAATAGSVPVTSNPDEVP